MRPQEIPVFITCRDRVSILRQLVSWLEAAGQEQIVLLDNDSTYEPLLEYYERTPHQVLRLERNYGHLALYETGRAPQGHFILSDPDLIPLGPPDGVGYLLELSQRYPQKAKWGFGLSLDGASPQAVGYAWEQELWGNDRLIEPGLFDAPIDTTLALYPPAGSEQRERHHPSIRTGPPYVMRHPDWEYWPGQLLSEEDAYYHRRALASSATTLGGHLVEDDQGRLRLKG